MYVYDVSILILLFSLLYNAVSAQVKFEAQTERSSYGLNERIQLVFSINNEGDNFEPPKFSGFKTEGPFINRGNQTSITVVNGKVSQKREISTQVIYYLTPIKKGVFTIGAASIQYNETTYRDFENGILHHDDVITLSKYMFQEYGLECFTKNS